MIIWPKKTVVIRTSPEQVFDYVCEPVHQVELWPNIVNVSQLELQPGGGFNFRCQYKLAGRLIHLDARLSHYVHGCALNHTLFYGLNDVVRTSWSFDAHVEGVLVGFACRGLILPSMKPWLPEALLTRVYRREVDLALDHLKRYMETSEASLDLRDALNMSVERKI